MSFPVAAPRLNPGKKPVPAPRTLIPVATACEETKENDNNNHGNESEGKNTFRRKVQTISNDIGGRVNEGKKAVLASTRQSVRKITRRFTTHFTEPTDVEEAAAKSQPPKEIEPLNFSFNISFDSPISSASISDTNKNRFDPIERDSDRESIYTNVTNGRSDNGNIGRKEIPKLLPSYVQCANSYYDDDDGPPPPYPPPALPVDTDETYDVPSVVSSGTVSSDDMPRTYNYERVYPSHPINSDSESFEDLTSGTIDRNVQVNRSGSWIFQNLVNRPCTEPTYNNVDNTPPLSTTTSSERSVTRENSIYVNCLPELRPPRPDTSLIREFDPITFGDMSHADELSELEKTLQGDMHGSFNMDNLSVFEDASEADDIYFSPPPPPDRKESLFINDNSPPSSPKSQLRDKLSKDDTASSVLSQSSWYLDSSSNNAPPIERSNSTKSFSQFLKTKTTRFLKRAEELKSHFTKKDNMVARPMIQIKQGIQQKGMLFRVTNGPVDDLFGELNARWCVLKPGALMCHSDNSCDTIKENISIESILSIQIVKDPKLKYKHEEDDLFCFELNTAGKVRAGYVFGTKSQSERRIWMQNLADNMCHAFGSRITSDYKRIGWCYLKDSVNGEWKGAWLCLVRRELHYLTDTTPLNQFDLRKARCFKMEPHNEESPDTADRGPNFVIHFTKKTFYFRMWTQRETKIWCHIIKLAARDNGPNLNQQQLTKDDVPVIVAKCINFLFVYGSMAEGIYRKNGSATTVADLVNQFRTDAWSVTLTNKYSAHDVATVLKRFFKDLAEPLIDKGKREYLYQVSLVKNEEDCVRMYKGIFDQINKIAYNTTRMLLGHLHFISSQSDKNKMTVQSLATIWGPTLLDGSHEEGNKDRVIVTHLISLYQQIFPEDLFEKEKEKKMADILKKHSRSSTGPVIVKPAGDFRVWVFLYNKEGKSFNMLFGPNKTAYEILCELSSKVGVPVHELVLEEWVLNDNLTRPIHHSEKVLDVIMRWGSWNEADCKTNCLILNNISKYWEYLTDNNEPLSGDLKFADNKTKNVRSYKFEFQQAKLTYYKERQTNNMLGQWNIEDIFIYFGVEQKRSQQFAITFFPRMECPKRDKQHNYFGNILVFPDLALKARWISTMWRAEHHGNLTPPPQHVNLMSS